ncbi:hypothetical protein COCON_G00114550 [Conger conger]|uniref:Uncharacterized protein n=1 Tax=Conger conger TaxID=82655 RepID=A0A9Q1DFP1_CONCO|nr:hypothetical protein COCON_G00114550 [Conger conger]
MLSLSSTDGASLWQPSSKGRLITRETFHVWDGEVERAPVPGTARPDPVPFTAPSRRVCPAAAVRRRDGALTASLETQRSLVSKAAAQFTRGGCTGLGAGPFRDSVPAYAFAYSIRPDRSSDTPAADERGLGRAAGLERGSDGAVPRRAANTRRNQGGAARSRDTPVVSLTFPHVFPSNDRDQSFCTPARHSPTEVRSQEHSFLQPR